MLIEMVGDKNDYNDKETFEHRTRTVYVFESVIIYNNCELNFYET